MEKRLLSIGLMLCMHVHASDMQEAPKEQVFFSKVASWFSPIKQKKQETTHKLINILDDDGALKQIQVVNPSSVVPQINRFKRAAITTGFGVGGGIIGHTLVQPIARQFGDGGILPTAIALGATGAGAYGGYLLGDSYSNSVPREELEESQRHGEKVFDLLKQSSGHIGILVDTNARQQNTITSQQGSIAELTANNETLVGTNASQQSTIAGLRENITEGQRLLSVEQENHTKLLATHAALEGAMEEIKKSGDFTNQAVVADAMSRLSGEISDSESAIQALEGNILDARNDLARGEFKKAQLTRQEGLKQRKSHFDFLKTNFVGGKKSSFVSVSELPNAASKSSLALVSVSDVSDDALTVVPYEPKYEIRKNVLKKAGLSQGQDDSLFSLSQASPDYKKQTVQYVTDMQSGRRSSKPIMSLSQSRTVPSGTNGMLALPSAPYNLGEVD